MTLRPHSIAHSIITDPNTGRATGIRIIDAETHEKIEFFAKVIFLNASALNTTALMLSSKSPHHPNGFANSSGVLGHYLMDHQASVGATGIHSGYQDKYYKGRRSTSVYIPRFRNVGQNTRTSRAGSRTRSTPAARGGRSWLDNPAWAPSSRTR